MILCARPECQTTAGCKCGSPFTLKRQAPTITLVQSKPPLLCSFCGRPEDEVGAIVGGVMAFICDGCHEVAGQEIERIKKSRPRATVEN